MAVRGLSRLTVVAFGLLLALTPNAPAQSIAVKVSSKNATPGELLKAAVSVTNLSQANAPAPPQSPDFDIKQLGVSQQVSTQFINGQQSTQQTYIYTFDVTPLHAGILILGPFTVKNGNEELASDPVRIRVSENKSSNQSSPLLIVEVEADPPRPYVGQKVTLQLNVWIRQYNKDGITLSAQDFWNLQDKQFVSLGIFQNDNVSSREARRADAQGVEDDYFVYTWEATVYPTKPGPYDLGNIKFGVQYPLTFSGRDIFGRLSINRVKRVAEAAKNPDLEVLPIPDADRPADFNGAVGRYVMKARAKPTEVQAGDPITLTLDISGSGDLERLSAPRLLAVPDLVHNFDISGETPAGEMIGQRKSFALTIRPLREDVREIPRLPFSYFDTDSKKFGTSWTSPIPIKVRPAERLALSSTPAPSQATGAKSAVVETTEGLLANFTDADELLANQSFEIGPSTWTLLAACPMVFAAVWFTEKRKIRLGSNSALTRRNRAYSVAKALLQNGGEHQGPTTQRAREAIVGYIADRCNVPAGGLTRQDAVALVSRRGLSTDVISSLDGFLEMLEKTQYGGGTYDGDVEPQARKLLDALEAHRIQ
jgi:hypothetical protein